MLKRKAIDQLAAWKAKDKKKCLIVQGARQVGKTYLIEAFANENYEEVLSVNFKKTPSAKEIFSGDLDTETLLRALKFRYPGYRLEPRPQMPSVKAPTLLFFDEIQECPEAITSLKFWTMDGRYDVIASGSLLGIDYNRASSYPVGYVDYLMMYGLDFEEFLWAQGITQESVDVLRDAFKERRTMPEAIHSEMMRQFRTFMALGGMPEVVQRFQDTGDFKAADETQRSILTDYLYDIAHYATASEKIKAEKCFLSLGRQLLDKENHKFQYKEVEKGARAQKYLTSIDWLTRANIAQVSRNVSKIQFDLEDYQIDDNFRVYPTDLSLLLAMRDFSLKQQIVENSILDNTKGGMYESVAADLLQKKGYVLHFYRDEKTKREIEFLIQKDGQVIPIEIKAGRTPAKSLTEVVKANDRVAYAYKFLDGNVGVSDTGVISMPLYMLMFV